MELILLENAEGLNFKNSNTVVVDCKDIKPCIGCAGCWVKIPGTCVLPDRVQHYAENITKFDTITIISKLCFGGFSYPIKRVIDRCIGYLDTFMVKSGNDMRHGKRYDHSFHLNVIFYGNTSIGEKEDATELVKACCKNYYVDSYNIEFVNSFATAYILLGGEKNDAMYMNHDDIIIPKHVDLKKKEKSIAVINASPRKKKAASEYYSNKLIEICNRLSNNEMKIDKYYWDSTKPLSGYEIMKFTEYESIVFCLGVYIDTLPSHVIQNLQRIDEYLYQYLKNHTYGPLADNIRNTRIYVLSNNGLAHGNQSIHTIQCFKNFSLKNKFNWVNGMGIGGGPVYANPKTDYLLNSDSKEVYDAFTKFCDSIVNYDQNERYSPIFTNCHIPIDDYINSINTLWKKALTRNLIDK